MFTQARQGDVLLKKVSALPEGARKLPHTTVALGEATGHNHSFAFGAATLFEAGAAMYVVVDTQPAVLTHQEHGAIAVAPGVYEVIRQREYTPLAVRRVID